MPEKYREIPNTTEISGIDGLNIPRARHLAEAIEGHPHFSIVSLCKRTGPNTEVIVIDVETDKVPPKNPYGIEYRERLGLLVSEDTKQLIDVRCLRENFPVLPHQNLIKLGDAPSLCLYFEPPIAVSRTWTPQNFLQRIQWWLYQTARGELHPADQPVENLFFATRYELVIPWNFDELRKKDSYQRFIVTALPTRPDESTTFMLEPVATGDKPPEKCTTLIELTLPPIVSGVVEGDPASLGELDDVLKMRGIDLFQPLREILTQRVGTTGVLSSSDEPFTIILLNIPVSRTKDAPPVATSRRAILIPVGQFKIGADIGALFSHEGKYFSAAGLLNVMPATAWRDQDIFPVDVLRENDAAAARQQSGVHDEGPQGLLVGAGSLGSAMLNLWTRCGWGKWTILDKDHVKPHNLSRHAAYNYQIGYTKVQAVAELQAAIFSDTEISGVFGDACDFAKPEVFVALKSGTLVIDASTTLEYPRLASTLDDLPRHISVFITPTANAGVLLAEDAGRTKRLRTLEAQYYRSLINNDWGAKHLEGNLSTFWSGASCRDISAIIPYSRITAQASTLAEQVRLTASGDTAIIRVWERDPETGGVKVYDVENYPEHRKEHLGLNVYIDTGVEHQLRALRSSNLPNETGGVLLGYYDFNINAAVVVCGLPAPPDSKSSLVSFERGTSGLVDAVNEATRRTAGVVGYIGEWHSHPRGHSASPSGDDIIQLVHLSFGMANDGLPALQLIVGEQDFQIFQGIAAT
jgi:integrative and conjugative element protein (TIGR02256 family)